jgi:hypothetical protein
MEQPAPEPLDLNSLMGTPEPAPLRPHYRPLTWAHLSAAVLAAIAFWCPLFWPLAMGIKDTATFSEGIGRMLVVFAVVIGVVAAVDRLTRRWSRWPSVAVLVLASALVCWVGVAAMTKARDTMLASQLDAAIETGLTRVRSMDPRTTTRQERAAAVTEVTQQLKAKAAAMPARVVGVNLVLFDETAAIIDAAAPYNTAMAALNELGGIDPASMHTKDDVTARLDGLATATREHQKYVAFLENLRNDLIQRCKSAGIDPSTYTKQIEGFAISVGGPGTAGFEMNRLETAILSSQVDYLTVLRDGWGQWAVQEGQVVFSGSQRQELIKRFNAAFKAMQRDQQQQQQLRQRIYDENASRR